MSIVQCVVPILQDSDNKVSTEGREHDKPALHVIRALGRHADEQ